MSYTTHPPSLYRDAILASLLIDLFMSKKEEPHAENITNIEQQPPRMATANTANNQKRGDLRKTV